MEKGCSARAEWEEGCVQGRRQRQVWMLECSQSLVALCLRKDVAGFHNACDLAAAGAQFCCVAVVGRGWQSGVCTQKDQRGKEGFSVLVRVAESAEKAGEARGHAVDMCGVIV